ncbi:ATP-binding cassette domain-containing protein [Sedimentitalea sp. JM2-8]|uniref:ATP-binding cassette domain-containing protein n=1 Tax=Sedimentitalea xiamensis TaxID=3050037 RepID=A0ABT7FJT3_9RHOB|nr:oligopeptide/dipeptide ABC transporter ATP-binding protein [Sedimentitalea xiamensis]MDK3075385.1 ATP-binding cassette domain-containing protein [Sedimentitalea xiamensis]
MTAQSPILTVSNASKEFDVSAPWLNRVLERKPKLFVKAVDDVSFTVPRGSCFSIVGESGCGKSTVARLVTGLYATTAGDIRFSAGSGGEPVRVQMIFQDPHSSLNPRWRVGDIIAEPIREMKLRASEAETRERVEELLSTVGLAADDARNYPHEFSGGQRQRISIARALASEPELLVCDEPTSALDVSVQAQILNLMRRLQQELGLTYLFISHDLSVVRHMSDTIAVMYLGRIVEMGPAESLFNAPQHPYSRLLLGTIPDIHAPHRDRALQSGEPPSPLDPPLGCAFHPRCALANERCGRDLPELLSVGAATVRCHAVEEGRAQETSVSEAV